MSADRVRHRDFIHQLILNRPSLEEMGRVDRLWMDVDRHRVLGLICKSGILGGKRTVFTLAQVISVGESGVITQADPDTTDARTVAKLPTLIDMEVWTEGGDRLGKITDCEFHLRTGEITNYLLVNSSWEGVSGDLYGFAPRQIVSIGKRRVLLPAVASLHLYKGELHKKLDETKEAVKERYTQASEEVRSQAEIAREKAQQLADQTKARVRSLSEQAREKAQILNTQLQQDSKLWFQQAKDRSKTLMERLKEGTLTLGEQLEDGIQILTVQAEEILDRDPTPPADDESIDDWFDFDEPEDAPEAKPQDTPQTAPVSAAPATPSAPATLPAPAAPPAAQESPPVLEEDDDPWI